MMYSFVTNLAKVVYFLFIYNCWKKLSVVWLFNPRKEKGKIFSYFFCKFLLLSLVNCLLNAVYLSQVFLFTLCTIRIGELTFLVHTASVRWTKSTLPLKLSKTEIIKIATHFRQIYIYIYIYPGWLGIEGCRILW